jgi:hypothetical protein
MRVARTGLSCSSVSASMVVSGTGQRARPGMGGCHPEARPGRHHVAKKSRKKKARKKNKANHGKRPNS